MIPSSEYLNHFEEAIKELEKLVDSLDKGDVSLDEAIAAYDRGSQLKDYCQNKLHEAKMKYDHVIIDTPPCLLVSDTFSISHLADLLLFIVRCDHTDYDVLEFLRDSYKKGIIKELTGFVALICGVYGAINFAVYVDPLIKSQFEIENSIKRNDPYSKIQ